MDYATWISMTKTLTFQIAFWSVFAFFLLSYLLVASIKHAKTSDGRKLKSRMISHGNAWIPVLIWIIVGGLFYIIVINPLWLKWFGN